VVMKSIFGIHKL